MRVTLPKELLGSGVQVWGRLSVCIPRIRVRGSRDVTLYEGTAPVLPGDGSVADVNKLAEIDTQPTATYNEMSAPPPEGKLTFRVLTLAHLNPFCRQPKTSPASLAEIRTMLRTWGKFKL